MRGVVCVLAAACLVALLHPTEADLVCGLRYCEQHASTNPCPAPVTASSCRHPAVFRAQHSGKCGCCPACVTLLSKGESCKTYSKELGETPSAICRENLTCVSGKCEQITHRN